jgi:hypothetical protein
MSQHISGAFLRAVSASMPSQRVSLAKVHCTITSTLASLSGTESEVIGYIVLLHIHRLVENDHGCGYGSPVENNSCSVGSNISSHLGDVGAGHVETRHVGGGAIGNHEFSSGLNFRGQKVLLIEFTLEISVDLLRVCFHLVQLGAHLIERCLVVDLKDLTILEFAFISNRFLAYTDGLHSQRRRTID